MLKTWCRLCLDFQLLTQWARIEVRVWLHLQRDIKKSSQRSCRYISSKVSLIKYLDLAFLIYKQTPDIKL